MRRRLGPASWLVFEELLLAATPVGNNWQAPDWCGGLAERTGLSKDTVAFAVARLRRAGLVTPRQDRMAGLFAAGVYELTFPNGITVSSSASIDTHLGPSPTSRNATVDSAQLSFLAFEH